MRIPVMVIRHPERLRKLAREGGRSAAQHPRVLPPLRRRATLVALNGMAFEYLQRAAVGIHQDVALAPEHLLAGIISVRATGFGGPDALTVEHRRGRAGVSADPFAVAQQQV